MAAAMFLLWLVETVHVLLSNLSRVEVALINLLPGLEAFVFCVCFVQNQTRYWEAHAANAFIKSISFFLSSLLFLIRDIGIKEAHVWHVCCKDIRKEAASQAKKLLRSLSWNIVNIKEEGGGPGVANMPRLQYKNQN